MSLFTERAEGGRPFGKQHVSVFRNLNRIARRILFGRPESDDLVKVKITWVVKLIIIISFRLRIR